MCYQIKDIQHHLQHRVDDKNEIKPGHISDGRGTTVKVFGYVSLTITPGAYRNIFGLSQK